MEGKLYLKAEKNYPLKTALVLLGFRNHPNLQNRRRKKQLAVGSEDWGEPAVLSAEC